MKRYLTCSLALAGLCLVAGCDRGKGPAGSQGAATQPGTSAATAAASGTFTLPEVELTGLPMKLQMRIGAARQLVKRSPDDVAKLTELGALYYAHDLSPAAIACFKRVTELEPAKYTNWYALARAYDNAHDTAQAVAMYDKTLAVQAEEAQKRPGESQELYLPARLRLGTLLVEKDPARAAQLLGDVLAKRPNNVMAHHGLAKLARARGQLDEAAGHLVSILKAEPSCATANEMLAALRESQGKREEAERLRDRAARGRPLPPIIDVHDSNILRLGLDVETLLVDARLALARQEIDRAIALVQQAREFEGRDVLARNALAAIHLSQGKYSEAAQEFREILEVDPNFASAQANLATALSNLKQYDEAERLLLALLERDPSNGQTLESLCTLEARRGTPDKAVALLQRAREAAPEDANVQYQVGRIFLEMRRFQDGLVAARKAVELEPGSPTAHHLVGALLRATNDDDGARRACAEALRLDPTYLPALSVLMEMALHKHDYGEAQRLVRDGLAANPDSDLLLNTLAWLLATSPKAEQRNGEEAIKLAEKACKLTNNSDYEKLDTLAAAYAEAGRFDEARRWSAEAVRLARAAGNADSASKYESREQLYKANKPYHEAE